MTRIACASLLALAPVPAWAIESEDCLIAPGMTVDLAGAIAGQLSSVSVDVGDHVKEGQVIAALRTEVQEANLALAQQKASGTAALEAARARMTLEAKALERAETLLKRGVATQVSIEEQQAAYQVRKNEFEEAEMELSLGKLEMARAEAELEIRRIRAPIDGVVAERHLDPGEYLRNSDKVLTLVKLDPLRVDVFLPQSAYGKVKPGDPVAVQPDLFADSAQPATVDVVDTMIDSSTATFRVRLKLPNPQGKIVPGIRCLADFDGLGN